MTSSVRLVLLLTLLALVVAAGVLVPDTAAAACTYTLGPAVPQFGMNGGNGSVSLTTQPGCPSWLSTSNQAWLAITSDLGPRSGNGSVTYTVSGNNASASRSATLMIANKSYTVTQAACAYAVGPPTPAAFPALGGNGSVAVTTGIACQWPTTSAASWLTITSGASQVGNGSATYTVAANTTGAARSGSLTVAGKAQTISQATCPYTLGATTKALGVDGGAGSVSVTTGDNCPWASTTTAGWAHITSPLLQVGNGSVTYTADPNGTLAARTAPFTIAAKPYTVTEPACAFALSPTTPTAFPPLGGNGSVTMTTGSACPWTPTTPATSASWLTLTSPGQQMGNGSITYTVGLNLSGSARSSTLSAGGKTQTVSQATCAYALGASSAKLGVDGGAGSVTVTTANGCPWQSVMPQAAWVHVTSPLQQIGNGSVTYTVDANGGAARTAPFTIANKPYTVTEAGCAYALSPTSAQFAPIGGNGSVTMTTGTQCAWQSSTAAPWLAITSPLQQMGNGSITYTVPLDNTGAARSGTILAGGKTHTVSQKACTFGLTPTTQAIGVNGGDAGATVTTQDGCPWTAASNQVWVTVNSPAPPTPQIGGGNVSYTAAPNSGVARSAKLTVAGKTLTVNEAACTFALGPPVPQFPPIGGNNSVTLTTGNACTWSATSNQPWVTIGSGGSGPGSGTVGFSVAPNTTSSPRTATLTIAGKPYAVSQANCTYTLSPATSPTFPVEGGSNGNFNVITADGCAWTATTLTPWISVTSPALGVMLIGNGSVTYTVAANTTSSSRSGTVTVAGKNHTVNQTAAFSGQDLRITLTSPGDSSAGKSFQPPLTVKNAGAVAAGPFDVGIFVSQEATAGSGMLLQTAHIASLGPGASIAPNVNVSFPNDLAAGTYYMSAVGDVNHALKQPATVNHNAMVGPFKVGQGVQKFKDVSASVQFTAAPIAPGFNTIASCSLAGTSLNLTGSSSVNDPVFNPDGSVSATGNVTLTGAGASFVGTFDATVTPDDRASLIFNFTTATVGVTTTTATATATGAIKFASGAGAAGAGGGLGFVFQTDQNGFTGTLANTGCAFTGSFTATVDQVFDLFFLVFLDAGGFSLTGTTPSVKYPVPFTNYEAVLSVVDSPASPLAPNPLPDPSTVTFIGPTNSNMNPPGVAADPSFSSLDQADGFAEYLTPFITSTTGPPDGPYTVNYKGERDFFENINAAQRAVIPVPTVTLDTMGNLQRVTWQYHDRQTGVAITPPPFIGLIGVLFGYIDPNGALQFCSSPFFEDRSVTSFDLPVTNCPSTLVWKSVFGLDFIFVDSLTFNAYGVAYNGPRETNPLLAVAVSGPGTVSGPGGISCVAGGSNCSAQFAQNTRVTLTATPASGAIFQNWIGACSGPVKTCTVTMSTDQPVAAVFGSPPPKVQFLNNTCVTLNPAGPGCNPIGGSYTAKLTSSQGEAHTWTSLSLVSSAPQTVLSGFLNGFDVFLAPTFPQAQFNPIVFSGSPFLLLAGHQYTIRFDVSGAVPTPCPGNPQFCISLFDTTGLAAPNGTYQSGFLPGWTRPTDALPPGPRPQAPSAP